MSQQETTQLNQDGSQQSQELSLASIALKGKRKPRGKPFEKGNKIGHRFKPGEIGNPEGSSKLQCLGNELRAQLPSVARTLVERAIKRAHKNSNDLKMLWDRAEGPMQDSEGSSTQIKVLIINGTYRPPRDNGTEAGS